jgi:toxin ParE1/3/4
MPNKLRARPQVERDLDSIWSYIAADSVRAADRLLDRIGKAFEMLVHTPLAGRERPELGRGLRSFAVGNYVIFYVARSDGVEIVRVLNGRQDIAAEDME